MRAILNTMKAIVIFLAIFFITALPAFAADPIPDFPISPVERTDYVTADQTPTPALPNSPDYMGPIDQMGPPTPVPNGSVNTELKNPLGGINDPESLAKAIGKAIVDLAIPVAVVLIIWVGVQFMLAGGNSEKIGKAKKALLWIVVGLAIIFIGDGFIALIKDILSLQ